MPLVKLSFRFGWIGFSALTLTVSAIQPETLAQRLRETSPPRVLDVRPTHEFEIAHIPGAMNIPLEVLGRRTLPPLGEVIIVADGQGAVDPAAAAALLRQRDGIQVDILEGGFAAWESSQGSSTRRSGLLLESLPALTYDQLLAGKESDVVLVDLRQPVAAMALTEAKSSPQLKSAKTTGTTAVAAAVATPAADPIVALAGKLRGARVAGDPFSNPAGGTGGAGDVGMLSTVAAAPAGKLATTAASNAVTTTPTTTSPTQAGGGVAPLLVLIDENDGRAQETARRLLASGNRRFVILSGGLEAVRMEGRSLVERTGGTVKLGGTTP